MNYVGNSPYVVNDLIISSSTGAIYSRDNILLKTDPLQIEVTALNTESGCISYNSSFDFTIQLKCEY